MAVKFAGHAGCKRLGRLLFVASWLLCAIVANGFASDDEFLGPANWGGTGLMEVPTARVMKENTYRMGASQIFPYQYYYLGMGAFKRFEVSFRVTQILGVKALLSGYGDTKDKALDIKYQLIPEGKYMPALSLGIMDPHGTRLYASQYLVASKQIYPFDFTIGLGNGRFGKRPLASQTEGFNMEMFENPRQWLSDSNVFWGIQFAPSPKFALMMEYNPIEYQIQTSDGTGRYFRRPVPLQYDFGLRYKPYPWVDLDVTYQRGNYFGLGLSTVFDIGNPLVPIRDKQYVEPGDLKSHPLQERIAEALYGSGFTDIGILFDKETLWIEAQNTKYFYSTRALGVIVKLLPPYLPPAVRVIRIILKENGIPMVQFDTTREDILEYREDRMTFSEFQQLAKIATAVRNPPEMNLVHKKPYFYGLKPSFRSYLNDPSGFFKYRLGVEGWAGYHPWKGASFVAAGETYPINTVSTSNNPLSRPVRSDLVPYLEETMILSRLMFQQLFKTEKEIYGVFSAGYLEVEYAGANGQVGMPVMGGRFLVGLSGSITKKRVVGQPFQVMNSWIDYFTPFYFNARLNVPEQEIYVDVNAGRFLAGDVGARVTVSKYIKGVTISAWYSFTNTSVFTDPYNRGYNDKGVAVSIPMRLFEGTDTRTSYGYAVSPWTRDVAQDIDQYTNVFDFIGRNVKAYLAKDRKMME